MENKTIEEVAAFNRGYIAGAKNQSEQMYSEEEVKQMLCNRLLFFGIPTTESENQEWFEEFKKK
jgi:hypothetical protein